MDLLIATRNRHKTREVRELLGDNFNVSDLSICPAVEMPNETGTTFAENAILKAVSVSQDRRLQNWFVIADDSGLEVNALGGAPGIFSARYAGEPANDAANINKLLRELKNAARRSARFHCVIALARAGKAFGTFQGTLEGEIVDSPRGASGFGYDPVFQPTGFDKTFAEMTSDVKNKISHRANAIAALQERLREIRD
jgi:XTP/dITP diphosphohydrolase